MSCLNQLWKYGCGSLMVINDQRDQLSINELGSQSGSQNQFSTLQITVNFQ